jgi:hypothetical protein
MPGSPKAFAGVKDTVKRTGLGNENQPRPTGKIRRMTASGRSGAGDRKGANMMRKVKLVTTPILTKCARLRHTRSDVITRYNVETRQMDSNVPCLSAKPNALAQQVRKYRWTVVKRHLLEAQAARKGDAA